MRCGSTARTATPERSSSSWADVSRTSRWTRKRFRVALPSLAEQEAIGNYLDSIADRTARAVSRARSQISCMHEYRTRLITDVVTGKLDVREAAAPLPEVDPLEASGDPMSGLGAETAKESHRLCRPSGRRSTHRPRGPRPFRAVA